MEKALPSWAIKKATAEDRDAVQQAQRRDTVSITWPERKPLKEWAKRQGWPTPWFGFENAFISKVLEDDESFRLALNESGIQIHIPLKSHTITADMLKELDDLYDERGADGRPNSWGPLVTALREIRRAVEAGVEVKIEGTPTVLKSWQGFYDWAHGRYHMLEDGYDSWIGDDR